MFNFIIFYIYILFLMTRPEMNIWISLVLTETAKFRILSVIPSDVSLLFRSFVVWGKMIWSGGVSSKQPLRWWTMPSIVVAAIYVTKIFIPSYCLGANPQCILLLNLQQSRLFSSCFLYFAFLKDLLFIFLFSILFL